MDDGQADARAFEPLAGEEKHPNKTEMTGTNGTPGLRLTRPEKTKTALRKKKKKLAAPALFLT